MASNSIEKIVKDADTHSTAPLTHGSPHAPLVGLWVVSFDTGDGIPTAPPANWEYQEQKKTWYKFVSSNPTL